MRDNELLAEWVGDVTRDVRRFVADLPKEALYWQADAEGNSIGVTVWHIARALDFLVVRALEDRPAEEEQWHTRGWHEVTGYDPRGLGKDGWGILTGYTQEQVKAVPHLPAQQLLAYLDQTCAACRDYLLALPEGAFEQPAPGFKSSRTVYAWLKPFVKGCVMHVGEIQTLIAMQKRAGLIEA